MVIVFQHAAFNKHITPPGHPEQVARLAAVEAGLAGLSVERRACPVGADADVLRCHPAAYLARVRAASPETGWAQLDGDTYLSPGSVEAALRAVGGACAAVDAVMSGGRAFVAARPPGHHAETAVAMGFCIFGTVAIAAKHALAVHGLERVAIVDFDVHHGNGTQDLLWDEPGVRFVSSHQMPLYPGTGAPGEVGAHGQILNLALRAGSDGAAMRAVYEGRVLPMLRDYAPQLLLISAGFDAHQDDPLAGLNWVAEDYRWLTRALCAVAGGRVVSCLEGGYDLDALRDCVAAHVGALGEE
ncbi:MAG: histone deacetylase family protein [Paracoccaceae bacterium]